ncbi:MAG: type I-E CRISPR-associated protein Cas6/Cse3/CasE [Deltaproteobacteria bacterium]|nr:type I-E CRISPR-associated protein Cas6/Cse3/CasE [Deltaproteobacteria bacterium]
MYISRIQLKHDTPNVKELVRLLSGDGYHVHRLIWNLYEDTNERKRDFLYRQEGDGVWPFFYAVSERFPIDKTGMWQIDSKTYSPKLLKGQLLSFIIRVNPIRAKRDKQNKLHRHDIVMDAKTKKKQVGKESSGKTPLADIVQEEGTKWLEGRSGRYGFSIDHNHVRSDGYRQHVVYKRKSTSPIRFSTLDIGGVLTVIEPELFVKTLYKGIGPAKGFGCGMMMVKKI